MTDTQTSESGTPNNRSPGSITVEAALEVNRPVATCYNQLLRVDEIPRFLGGVQHVKRMGNSMTRWVASDEPTGEPWTVEIHDLVEDQRFACRRINGPHHEVRVQLSAVSPDRTRVNLVRKYDASIAPAVESEATPQARVEEDLHRFKRLVEARPALGAERPRRVDLRCELIGFAAPPHIVRIKFLPVANGWTLVSLSPAGAAPAVARWLESMGPTSIRVAGGIAPKVMSAHFERLPGYCDELVTRMQLRALVLTPDGTASLFLAGPPHKVDRFVAHQQLADANVRARDIRPAPEALELTRRQVKVLSLAVALGYYEVPHKLTLRDLGEKLGLSAGTVAGTLRGAEGAVISAYIDAVAEERHEENALEAGTHATPLPYHAQVGARDAASIRHGATTMEGDEDDVDGVDQAA